MRNRIMFPVLALLLSLTGAETSAQGLFDGFSDPRGQLTLAGSYTRSSFDQVFIRENEIDFPFGETRSDIYAAYLGYGVSEQVDLMVNLPFINMEASQSNDGSPEAPRVSGLQDLRIATEWLFYQRNGLNLTGGLEGSYPLGDYPGNQTVTIGFQNWSAGPRLMALYRNELGLFASTGGGYTYRQTVNRRFDDVDYDAPDAFHYRAGLGYAGARIFVRFTYLRDDAFGDGVLGMAPLPEVSYRYDHLMANVYYQFSELFGAAVSGGQVVSGRNTNQITHWSVGLVCQLALLKG